MSRSPSPIEVGDLDVDRSRQVLQHGAREPPSAVVLHPARLALVVAELRDREIEVAVAVEIAGAHVRHARDVVDQHAIGETPAPVVLEHDHRADLARCWERARRGWRRRCRGRRPCRDPPARHAPAPIVAPSGRLGERARAEPAESRRRGSPAASETITSTSPSRSRSTSATWAISGRSSAVTGVPIGAGAGSRSRGPRGGSRRRLVGEVGRAGPRRAEMAGLAGATE